MAYRDDIAALAARHAALETEVADKKRERDAARSLLADARARRALPVLDNIRIASPCRADWNAMTGDERVRHCHSCNKRVYNLSELTREAAQALIVEQEGNLCARYYQRADGTIILADCEIGAASRRRKKLAIAGAAAALTAGVAYKLLQPTPVEPRAATIDVVAPTELVQPSSRLTTTETAPKPPPQIVEPEPMKLQGAVSFHEITE